MCAEKLSATLLERHLAGGLGALSSALSGSLFNRVHTTGAHAAAVFGQLARVSEAYCRMLA